MRNLTAWQWLAWKSFGFAAACAVLKKMDANVSLGRAMIAVAHSINVVKL